MGIKRVNKKTAKAVIKTVDPNGDGQLEYKEILPMLKQPRKTKEKAASTSSFGLGLVGDVFSAISSSAEAASSRTSVEFASMGLSGIHLPEGLPQMPEWSMPEALPALPDLGLPALPDFSFSAEIIPALPDLGFSAAMPSMPSFMPSMPGFMSTKSSDCADVDLGSLTTEEAADLIWEQMRLYMKEKGGQRATELFKEIDKDRSGKVDADEFMAALERMEIKGVTKKLAKAVIKTVDPNGDGQLEYKEILPMLKEPRKKKK